MKSKDNKNIISAVEQVAVPLAEGMGYRVWDVEFVKEGADKYLRITLDNDEGITIEDCEKFHRAIDPVLDEVDPINEPYILEVSSPGLERELCKDSHIEACIGMLRSTVQSSLSENCVALIRIEEYALPPRQVRLSLKRKRLQRCRQYTISMLKTEIIKLYI